MWCGGGGCNKLSLVRGQMQQCTNSWLHKHVNSVFKRSRCCKLVYCRCMQCPGPGVNKPTSLAMNSN
jgi:hypothetical protein